MTAPLKLMMGAAGVSSADGSLWAWGANQYDAQLGLGDKVTRTCPVQVGDLTEWTNPGATWRSGFAIKSDGTLWSWGDNRWGQLGNGNTTNSSSPVQVGSLTNWFQVEGGKEHVYGIKTDGTLWAWGRNNYGQLGLGNTTDYSSPVQVGSLTNWKANTSSELTAGTPIKASAALEGSYIIKDDGTLWCWGNNWQGELGDGSTTARSSPVQIGSLTNWESIGGGFATYESPLAVKTDGTLWSWGAGQEGQNGQGNTTSYSSPVQIGSLTTWKYIAVSGGSESGKCAVKTDGTLWAWGRNGTGQLGLGSTTNYSSPVQVGSLTNWGAITPGTQMFRAIKTDGTLWMWGYNGYGNLGDGTTTNRSSPVQVLGGETTWGKIMAPGYGSFTIALQFN